MASRCEVPSQRARESFGFRVVRTVEIDHLAGSSHFVPEKTGPVKSKTDPRLHRDQVPYILFPSPILFFKKVSELIQVKTNKPPQGRDLCVLPWCQGRKTKQRVGSMNTKEHMGCSDKLFPQKISKR